MKRKHLILFTATPLFLAADLVTKRIAESRLALGESISIIGGVLDFRMALNRGAAFSLGQNWSPSFRTPFFLVVSLAALAAVLYLVRRVGDGERLAPFGLALILSGALGNIYDRLRFGHVVDFIDLHWKHAYHWPTFNVADIAITVGAILLFAYTVFVEPRIAKAPPEGGGGADAPSKES